MAPVIAIIGALEKEVRQIYAAVEKGTVADEAGLHIVGGEYHGFEIVATTAGMGTVNAAAAAQHLISAHGANAIIFSGIAGGLNPALHIGDVVIGEHLRYLDTDTALIAESTPGLEEFSSSDFLVELAEQTLRAHGFVDAALSEGDAATARAEADATIFRRNNTDSEPQRFLRGTIATGDRFVSGAEAKAAAIAATQGDCVEMEGAAIAHVAAKNGIDCLVLRAISDNCDESYDALSSREFDLEEYAKRAPAPSCFPSFAVSRSSSGSSRATNGAPRIPGRAGFSARSASPAPDHAERHFPWQRPSTTTRSISSPATARHRRSRRRPAPK